MIVGIDVAQLHPGVALLGDALLDGVDCCCLLLGGGLVVAHEGEQRGHVLLIGVAHGHGLCIVVQIVVAGAQPEAALSDAHDVAVSLTLVCAHTDAIHHG